jgi:hypothetical protein
MDTRAGAGMDTGMDSRVGTRAGAGMDTRVGSREGSREGAPTGTRVGTGVGPRVSGTKKDARGRTSANKSAMHRAAALRTDAPDDLPPVSLDRLAPLLSVLWLGLETSPAERAFVPAKVSRFCKALETELGSELGSDFLSETELGSEPKPEQGSTPVNWTRLLDRLRGRTDTPALLIIQFVADCLRARRRLRLSFGRGHPRAFYSDPVAWTKYLEPARTLDWAPAHGPAGFVFGPRAVALLSCIESGAALQTQHMVRRPTSPHPGLNGEARPPPTHPRPKLASSGPPCPQPRFPDQFFCSYSGPDPSLGSNLYPSPTQSPSPSPSPSPNSNTNRSPNRSPAQGPQRQELRSVCEGLARLEWGLPFYLFSARCVARVVGGLALCLRALDSGSNLALCCACLGTERWWCGFGHLSRLCGAERGLERWVCANQLGDAGTLHHLSLIHI